MAGAAALEGQIGGTSGDEGGQQVRGGGEIASSDSCVDLLVESLFGVDDCVRDAVAVVAGRGSGCFGVHCWEIVDTGAIVTSGTWESNEARQAGFAAAKKAGVDFAYDDRQLRPWDVFHLSPV